MRSFHKPIEDLLNNTKLLETKENNSNLRKSNRKTSNRSIFNPKKMKQSTLSQYTSNTETLEKNLLNNFDETDETYCEDLIMPSQSSKKYTRSFKIIKKEKLPIKIHTKLTDLEETNSLLILPTPVDDVIEIPDSMVMNELTDCLSEESVDIFNGIFAAKQKLKNEEKCNEEKNNCNKLAFKCSPIRKKSEKAKLPGFACADCEQYYSVVGYNMTAEQLQARKNKCSKHRQNVRLHDTPEGFWQPFFTPTQDEKYPKCTINEKDLHLHADKYEKR